jgi:hypothetical protein
MTLAARKLHESLIRAAKAMLVAWEKWLQEQTDK